MEAKPQLFPPSQWPKPYFRAPIALGRAILAAQSKAQLKPLLAAYSEIYGDIPDILCQLYDNLPNTVEGHYAA